LGQPQPRHVLLPRGFYAARDRKSALALEIRCDDDLRERKLRALRSHTSQVEPLVESVGVDTFARWWADAAFVDAATVHDTPTLVGRSVAA
jgi:hypothetical protein